MVAITYLPSTLLMGLFLLAIIVGFVRITSSERTTTPQSAPVPTRKRRTDTQSTTDSTAVPTAWIVGFLSLILAVGGGTVLFVGGISVPSVGTGSAGLLLAVLIGGLVCGYLISGLYISLRGHGRASAEAAAVAIWMLGMAALVLIAIRIFIAQ